MPVTDYKPSVATVGAWLRARTKTKGGAEAGTFNPAASADQDKTRPTSEEVQLLIDDQFPTFSAVFGLIPDSPDPDNPDAYRQAVAKLAALGVALEVELTYFPEQVATRRSPYPELKELYDQRFGEMTSLLGVQTDTGDVVPAGAGYPSYGGFPDTAIGMEFPW